MMPQHLNEVTKTFNFCFLNLNNFFQAKKSVVVVAVDVVDDVVQCPLLIAD
jgi:hypothetical protein